MKWSVERHPPVIVAWPGLEEQCKLMLVGEWCPSQHKRCASKGVLIFLSTS